MISCDLEKHDVCMEEVPIHPTDVDYDVNESPCVITWTDNSDNESGFKIRMYCGRLEQDFFGRWYIYIYLSSEVDAKPNSTSYVWGGLPGDFEWFYICAFNCAGESEYK
jgi:hypothetical protein